MHAALALYALWRYLAFRREQVTESNFRPMLRTTPAALKMMPETRPAPSPEADQSAS